jgi:hypothetical protein
MAAEVHMEKTEKMGAIKQSNEYVDRRGRIWWSKTGKERMMVGGTPRSMK